MAHPRVLYICPTSAIGGAETFIYNAFLGHKKSQRFQPEYLLFREGPLKDQLEEQGAIVRTLNTPPRLSSPSSWLKYSQDLSDLLAKNKYDIVHSTMAYAALFSALTAVRDSSHLWFQHGPVSGWQDRFAGLLPHTGLITNSPFTTEKQKAIEIKWPKRQRQLLELPLGTPPVVVSDDEVNNYKFNLLQQHKLPPDTIVLAMLCRIQSWKGVHLAIDAIKSIHQRTQSPIALFIWGTPFKGDDYYNSLLTQAKSLPIFFPGKTDQKNRALSATDILINASTQPEPFGLTLIEAMSAKCAVVAPNAGGPKTMFKDSSAGYHFTPKDTADLANKILQLVNHPTDLQAKKASALQIYTENYTIESMTTKLEEFYLNILSQQST